MKTAVDLMPATTQPAAEPTVGLVYGFWGQNIGNAFFNVGGQWILEQVFGRDAVGLIQDQPGYRTFHDQSEGNPTNALDLIGSLSPEYIVLQGPMLTETFGDLWGSTLERLTANGTRIVLLGAACFRYTEAEIAAATAVLERFPPAAVVTRDQATFEILQGQPALRSIPMYNGMDSAFAVPKAYTPLAPKALGSYIAMAFDRYPEPTYTRGGKRDPGTKGFEFDGVWWSYRQPTLPLWFANKGKAMAYIGAALDRRKLPSQIGDHLVVRPEHRFNPHMTWKIYRSPNAVASDEPFTYATMYGSAHLTLSDRVHACVLTLAYGGSAMLYSPSPRGALFARVGLEAVRERPVALDLGLRDEILQGEIDFLKAVL